MRFIHSVSFKKDEKELLKFAMKKRSFSEYIKELIEIDKTRAEQIFTKEEREEIERIIEAKIDKFEVEVSMKKNK